MSAAKGVTLADVVSRLDELLALTRAVAAAVAYKPAMPDPPTPSPPLDDSSSRTPLGSMPFVRHGAAPNRDADEPWAITHAAKHLGVCVRTLTNAEKAGTLRLYRVGTRVFMAADEMARVKRDGLKPRPQTGQR